MFETSKTIFKIDGKNVFCDVQEAFAIGKICFQFRQYDLSREKGNRLLKSIDAYMNFDEFSYFCLLLKTGRMNRMIASEKAAAGAGYPKPGYVLYGGTAAGQNTISRKIQVEGGMKTPYLLSALQGPGKVGKTGQIMPAYMDKDAEKVSVPMSEEMAIKLALSGERAITYYDTWCAMGTLNQNLARLKNIYRSENEHKERNNQSQQPYRNVVPMQQGTQYNAPQPQPYKNVIPMQQGAQYNAPKAQPPQRRLSAADRY